MLCVLCITHCVSVYLYPVYAVYPVHLCICVPYTQSYSCASCFVCCVLHTVSVYLYPVYPVYLYSVSVYHTLNLTLVHHALCIVHHALCIVYHAPWGQLCGNNVALHTRTPTHPHTHIYTLILISRWVTRCLASSTLSFARTTGEPWS
jgi:hypothetical protein